MAFATFGFFQVFNLLNVRSVRRSAFSRETLENRSAFVATAAVIVLLVLIVEMESALHGFMTTTDLTSGRWLDLCGVAGAGELDHRQHRAGIVGGNILAVPLAGENGPTGWPRSGRTPCSESISSARPAGSR